MKDRAAPKAKKSKKEKVRTLPGPKLVAGDIKPGIGHNSHTGEKHPEAVKLLDELIGLQAQKKAIAKAERDIRNRFKTEFGILASSVSREVSLRKLDPDVRVQVETNHEDFKKLTGYQPSLDFVGTKPTDASLKAQPSEAKLEERNTEPTRGIQGRTGTNPAKGFSVDIEDEAEGESDGIITREG